MNRASSLLLLTLSYHIGRPLCAQSYSGWTLAQSSHFEVFSQTNDLTVSKALLWFEQMRAFFVQDGLHLLPLNDQGKPPLRVIGFHSEKEYAEYRLRPLASAYYASDGDRDYIVMASLQSAQFSIAAHEYSHYIVHASGLKLPACLQEGLAEEFSTLRITPTGYWLGGDLPARTHTLQANKARLIPLADLFSTPVDSTTAHGRTEAELFYAESWALVDLLVTSPQYAPRFRDLVAEFNAGSQPAAAFQKVYHQSLDQLANDLAQWAAASHFPSSHPASPPATSLAPSYDLSTAHTHFLLAELSLVSGHVEQAKSRFQILAREQSTNPDVAVALGAIALRQGNRQEGLQQWRRAIKLNVQDPELCYRYALLAEEANVDAKEAKTALERAISLAPGFDDARYRLALIQYRGNDYRASLTNLRTMVVPQDPHRLYAYWTAMASCLLELNENEEARKIALEAAKAAQNPNDRMAALQLSNVAATDMNVQFSTDAQGHSQIVTTRIPHGTAASWNPFIEPSDAIQHASGRLRQVLCTDGKLTGFLLETSKGATVTLDVADPSRVLMRNSPEEFYCGPTRADFVKADYAVAHNKNLLRGLTFQP